MPSNSLLRWREERSKALDEIEAAHQVIGGKGKGRRFTTQQLNRAYAVLLVAQFQGYCRDLHTECIVALCSELKGSIRAILAAQLELDRKLDRGNPRPGNLGADFSRLGIDLWRVARQRDRRTPSRLAKLEVLLNWRDAIVHHNYDASRLGGKLDLSLAQVRDWRRALQGLAETFDEVMQEHLKAILGRTPWS